VEEKSISLALFISPVLSILKRLHLLAQATITSSHWKGKREVMVAMEWGMTSLRKMLTAWCHLLEWWDGRHTSTANSIFVQ